MFPKRKMYKKTYGKFEKIHINFLKTTNSFQIKNFLIIYRNFNFLANLSLLLCKKISQFFFRLEE